MTSGSTARADDIFKKPFVEVTLNSLFGIDDCLSGRRLDEITDTNYFLQIKS